jgi:hypothetical protein
MNFARIIFAVITIAAATSRAQEFQIDWFTIDGGGGSMSGGPFAVTGTIGQSDAGFMAGGQFTVAGGFWSSPTAPEPLVAPTLAISFAAQNQITLLWTPTAPGFVLQETTDLVPANWTNSPTGGASPVTVAASAATKFYRVMHP